MSLENTLAKLMQFPDLETYMGVVPLAAIEELETKTGCGLPSDYRKFLQRVGFALWDIRSVYGVYDEQDERYPPSYNYSAATQTTRARALRQDHPYPHLHESIVIGTDGMGGYFLLISAAVETPDHVIWVNQDEDWVVTQRWPGFAEYLADQLKS